MMIMMIRVGELGVNLSASRLGLVKCPFEYDKKPLDSIMLDNFSTNQFKVGFETAMLFSSLISHTVKLSTKEVFFSTGTCRQNACFVLKASNVDVSR